MVEIALYISIIINIVFITNYLSNYIYSFSKKSIENKIVKEHLQVIEKCLLRNDHKYRLSLDENENVVKKLKLELEKNGFIVRSFKDDLCITLFIN